MLSGCQTLEPLFSHRNSEMCQHWERGPCAQLISAISLIALCAIFVGSPFVVPTWSGGKEEEACSKREQEKGCYSNSNSPSSLFAFVRGQSVMIRRSPLHFMARPPLQHLPTLTHTHTHTHSRGNWLLWHGRTKEIMNGLVSHDAPCPPYIHTRCISSTHILHPAATMSVTSQWLSHKRFVLCVS